MVWAKIDDGFLDHPKALEAGEDAANLYLRGLVYCAKHLTDGRIPKAALRVLTGSLEAHVYADALVRVGLWEDAGPAWQVHDYLDWNEGAAAIRRERSRKAAYERDKRAKAKAGKQAAPPEPEPPADPPPPAEEPPVDAEASDACAGSSEERSGERSAEVPGPVPENVARKFFVQTNPDQSREEEEIRERAAATATVGSAVGGPAPVLTLVPKPPDPPDPAAVVFGHWAAALGKRGPKFDTRRRTLIARALKSHGLDTCLRAIDGVAGSAWHRGENPGRKEYTDLGLILRDAEHIERFAALADPPPEPPAATAPAPDAARFAVPESVRKMRELRARQQAERAAAGGDRGA